MNQIKPMILKNGKQLIINIAEGFYEQLPKEIFTEEILNDFLADVLLKECDSVIFGNIKVFRFKNTEKIVFVETFIEK